MNVPAALSTAWRAMQPPDLAEVSALSGRIHINYPERAEVLAEKLSLFPQGCFVLAEANTRIRGYCFSHPWTRDAAPPSLDSFLGALPEPPSAYFIHDLTLDGDMQGHNLAARLVPQLVAVARSIPLAQMALVAVNGSAPFWSRMGFQRTEDESLQASARKKYDASAVHMSRVLD